MDWSPQQVRALDAVAEWMRNPRSPVFYLAGYAGTGKTTLARHFAEGVAGRVLFAAFTGKAAHVMRQRGCPEVKTIHSLIYHPVEKSRLRLMALEADMTRLRQRTEPPATPEEVRKLQEEIDEEKKRVKAPSWDLNPDSDLASAALLIVDECSMVGEHMGEDLLSFRTPILALGDPAQLPPVFGAGYLTNREPDILLTEIHRQERDNPIVAMATTVRQGRSLEFGRYGESEVLPISRFDREAAIASGAQILVGKNDTRRRANIRTRAARGYPADVPVPGDRLVCLRNNHEIGLLNGAIWNITNVALVENGIADLEIRSEDDDRSIPVQAHMGPFLGEEVPYYSRRDAEEFDYGYALTVHKAQGSQFRDVVLVDESRCFRQDAWRHLYTGITRAIEKVTVVR